MGRRAIGAIILLTSCTEIPPGLCPGAALLVDDVCRITCTSSSDCLLSEACAGGACVPKAPSETPDIAWFTVDPLEIDPGRDVHIDYAVLFADRVEIGGLLDTTSPEEMAGTLVVQPTETTTYQLVAHRGSASVVSSSIQVVVRGSGPAILSFEARYGRTTIRGGESVLLEWSTSGADSIQVDGESTVLASSSEPSGALLVAPKVSSVYRLIAKAMGKEVGREVEILVEQPPRITFFTLDPTYVAVGDPSTAILGSWTIDGSEPMEVALFVDGALEASLPLEASARVVARPPHNRSREIRLIAKNAFGHHEERFVVSGIVVEEEPSTRENPNAIGDVVRWSSLAGNDEDWYRFTAPAGGGAVLFASGADNLCAGPLSLELFNPSGTLVESASGPCPLFISATDLAPGPYAAKVTPISGDLPITYGIGVDARPATCGDGWQAAFETCDDTNVRSGDGCDERCLLEPGYRFDLRIGAADAQPTTGDELDVGGGPVLVPLPFEAAFLGSRHAAIVVHEQGFVSFHPARGGEVSGVLGPAEPNAVIAPFAGAIGLGSSGRVLLDESRDRVRITYSDLTPISGVGRLDGTITLFADGRIRVDYGQLVAPVFRAGLEDARGEYVLDVCQGPCTPAAITSLRNAGLELSPHP